MFFKPKPHPAHVMAFFIERFAHGEIKLLRNEEFLPKLQECSACIVETTTLALVPALIGMPLLYAKYNKLARLEYGPALISYPRGHLLRNIADVSDTRLHGLRAVDDYMVPNVSDKVLRIIHSYTDYVNRVVWKRY